MYRTVGNKLVGQVFMFFPVAVIKKSSKTPIFSIYIF